MAVIRKRGEAWQAWVRKNKDGVKVYEESRNFPTERLARDWAKKLETDLLVNGTPKRVLSTKTLGELLDDYKASLNAVNPDKPIRRQMGTLLATLSGEFAKVKLSELRPKVFSDYAVSRKSKGTGGATVMHDLVIVQDCLNAAKTMYGLEIDGSAVKEALSSLTRMGVINRSAKRTRRPTAEELSALSERDRSTSPGNTVLAAVATLIKAPDAHELFGELQLVLKLALNNVRVALTGAAGVLNPLIDLRKRNPEGYEGVLALVEKKRADAGFDPLITEAAERCYDKTEYMREFMNSKRERERRAVEIENLIRPEREKLRGTPRIEFMRRQSAVWKTDRDRFLQAAQGVHGEGLNLEKRKAAIVRFWSAVDADLEVREQRAKEQSLLPVHKRQRPEESLEALVRALEFDPYRSKPVSP